MTTLMDPTDERVPVARQLAERDVVLKGTVALLDICLLYTSDAADE